MRPRRAAGCVLLLAVVFATGCGGGSQQPKANITRTGAPAQVRILQFYASPSVVESGDATLLCYSVEHARSVRIEPPVPGAEPSPIRCLSVTPARSARYTLTAAGGDGRQVSQSVEVQVVARSARPAPPAAPRGPIALFAASANQTAPGQPITLCYELHDARSATLEPGAAKLQLNGKSCLIVQPSQTTTYTLTATGPDGHTDTQRMTIRVQ